MCRSCQAKSTTMSTYPVHPKRSHKAKFSEKSNEKNEIKVFKEKVSKMIKNAYCISL